MCSWPLVLAMAGGEGFLDRNPTLSLRSGDATACVQMNGMNKENITGYFNLLKEVFDELDLIECIYNMDKTGVPLEPRPPKIESKKGLKKVRYRTSRRNHKSQS